MPDFHKELHEIMNEELFKQVEKEQKKNKRKRSKDERETVNGGSDILRNGNPQDNQSL